MSNKNYCHLGHLICGTSIKEACCQAVEKAIAKKKPCSFKFNGTRVVVTKDTDPLKAAQQYFDDLKAQQVKTENSPKYKKQQKEYERRRKIATARRHQEFIKYCKKVQLTSDFKFLLKSPPTPRTREEMVMLVDAFLSRKNNDYNTAALPAARLAEAAYDFMACGEGITGFQSGYATQSLIRNIRNLGDHPWKIVDFHDFLFPQLNPIDKIREDLGKVFPDLQKEARKLIRENEKNSKRRGYGANSEVLAVWKLFANAQKPIAEALDDHRREILGDENMDTLNRLDTKIKKAIKDGTCKDMVDPEPNTEKEEACPTPSLTK